MKVDYLSEFGFRLSDYGKYSTIVLFLPVAPRPPESPVGAAAGAPRAERCGAERSRPRPPLRAARSLRRRGAGRCGQLLRDPVPGAAAAPKLFPGPRRVRGCGAAQGAPGPSGARGRHQVLPGARSLFHFSFTCFTEVGLPLLPPLRPRSPRSRRGGRRGERGLRSARSFPAARPPRAGAAGGRRGRERMRRGSLWGF